MHRITNGKLWRTPISEMKEAIIWKFVIDLNVFKALSFTPKGPGAVQENNVVNASLWFVSKCCKISGKIAEGSIWSQVDSEFKCQKWLSLLLSGVLKIQAPPLILKADPHFEKKNRRAAWWCLQKWVWQTRTCGILSSYMILSVLYVFTRLQRISSTF